MEWIIVSLLVGVVALGAGYGLRLLQSRTSLHGAEQKAKHLLEEAARQAEVVTKQAKLESKEHLHTLRQEFEEKTKERRGELSQLEKRLQLSEVRNPATELAPGAFGVREPVRKAFRPVPARELDLVLVPGLAFDRFGHRLGHGHGYFDRFLARIPKETPTVGLAFGFQVLDRLPTTSHDFAVQTILTA